MSFFSSLPSNELPLSPPYTTGGKQSRALVFPWKGAVTQGVRAGPLQGAARGPEGTDSDCSSSEEPQRGQMEGTEPWFTAGHTACSPDLLPALVRVSSPTGWYLVCKSPSRNACLTPRASFLVGLLKDNKELSPNLKCLLVLLSGIGALTQDTLWCFSQVKGTIEIGATEGRRSFLCSFPCLLGVLYRFQSWKHSPLCTWMWGPIHPGMAFWARNRFSDFFLSFYSLEASFIPTNEVALKWTFSEIGLHRKKGYPWASCVWWPSISSGGLEAQMWLCGQTLISSFHFLLRITCFSLHAAPRESEEFKSSLINYVCTEPQY